ncbi:MAG: hypothetical protein CM15mP47_1070 [Methanobacteriota archaeon]|nr:MAG: hypothetical protein CM15mP47_1070 [Euryarchaeota archaeon]
MGKWNIAPHKRPKKIIFNLEDRKNSVPIMPIKSSIVPVFQIVNRLIMDEIGHINFEPKIAAKKGKMFSTIPYRGNLQHSTKDFANKRLKILVAVKQITQFCIAIWELSSFGLALLASDSNLFHLAFSMNNLGLFRFEPKGFNFFG